MCQEQMERSWKGKNLREGVKRTREWGSSLSGAIQSSPRCLCWRYLHCFCWWYNSPYILHSSLPLLHAVFNTAQDTLCQLKRVLNADKTKFRLFTNSQTGPKRTNMQGNTEETDLKYVWAWDPWYSLPTKDGPISCCLDLKCLSQAGQNF